MSCNFRLLPRRRVVAAMACRAGRDDLPSSLPPRRRPGGGRCQSFLPNGRRGDAKPSAGHAGGDDHRSRGERAALDGRDRATVRARLDRQLGTETDTHNDVARACPTGGLSTLGDELADDPRTALVGRLACVGALPGGPADVSSAGTPWRDGALEPDWGGACLISATGMLTSSAGARCRATAWWWSWMRRTCPRQ